MIALKLWRSNWATTSLEVKIFSKRAQSKMSLTRLITLTLRCPAQPGLEGFVTAISPHPEGCFEGRFAATSA